MTLEEQERKVIPMNKAQAEIIGWHNAVNAAFSQEGRAVPVDMRGMSVRPSADELLEDFRVSRDPNGMFRAYLRGVDRGERAAKKRIESDRRETARAMARHGWNAPRSQRGDGAINPREASFVDKMSAVRRALRGR